MPPRTEDGEQPDLSVTEVRSGVPSFRARGRLSPTPGEGRPYLEPGRTPRRPRGAGPGLTDQAGAEGGVPALWLQREAAARAGPRAAARATRDLRLGRTTAGAAGAAGRAAGLRPAERGPEPPGAARRRYEPWEAGPRTWPGQCPRRHLLVGALSAVHGEEGDPGAAPTRFSAHLHTCPGAGAHLSRGPRGGRPCSGRGRGVRGPGRRGRLPLVAQGDLPLQPQHLPLGLAQQPVEVPHVEPLGALLESGDREPSRA